MAGRPPPKGRSKRRLYSWQMRMMELELDFLDLDQLDFSLDPQVPFYPVGLEEYKLDNINLASPGTYYKDVPPEHNPEAILDILVRAQHNNSHGASPCSDGSVPCEEEVENLKIDNTIAECFVSDKADSESKQRPVHKSVKEKGIASAAPLKTETISHTTPTKQKTATTPKDKKSQGFGVRFSNAEKQSNSTANRNNSKIEQNSNATGKQVADTTLLAEHSATAKPKGTLGTLKKLRSLFPERKSETKEQTDTNKEKNQKWQQHTNKRNELNAMGNKIHSFSNANDVTAPQLNEPTCYYNPLSVLTLPHNNNQSNRHPKGGRNGFHENRHLYSTSTDEESTTLSAANSDTSENRTYGSVSDVTDITDVTPMTSLVSSRKHSLQNESFFQRSNETPTAYVLESDDEVSDTSSVLSDLSPGYSTGPDDVTDNKDEQKLTEGQSSKYTNLLYFTARNGDSKSLGSLLSSEDVDCLHDVDGNTLAHYAASGGNTDCLRYLVARSNNVLSILNKNGLTPIMLAIQDGKLSCLEWYLNSQYSTEENINLVLYAADVGQGDCLRAVLRKFPASVSYADSEGNTALHAAASKGQMACLQALVDHRADVTARNHDKVTPLDCARQTNHEECVEYLRLVETNAELRTEVNHLSQEGVKLRSELEAKQDQKQMVISQRDTLQAELMKANDLNTRWHTVAQHVTSLLKTLSQQLEDIFSENSTLREKLNGGVKNSFIEEQVEDSLERIIMTTEEIEELLEENKGNPAESNDGETTPDKLSLRRNETQKPAITSNVAAPRTPAAQSIDGSDKRLSATAVSSGCVKPTNLDENPNRAHTVSSPTTKAWPSVVDSCCHKRQCHPGETLRASYETIYSTRPRQLPNSAQSGASALVSLHARGLTSSNDSIASSTKGQCMFENTMKAFDQVLCSSLESFATLDGMEKPPIGRLGPSPLALPKASTPSPTMARKSPDSSFANSTMESSRSTVSELANESSQLGDDRKFNEVLGDEKVMESSTVGVSSNVQKEIKSVSANNHHANHTVQKIPQTQDNSTGSLYKLYEENLLYESDEGQWDEQSSFNLELGPVVYEESAIDVVLQHIPTYCNRTNDYVESVASVQGGPKDMNSKQSYTNDHKVHVIHEHGPENNSNTQTSPEGNLVHVEDIQIHLPNNQLAVHQRYDRTISGNRLLKVVVDEDNNRAKAIGSLEDVRVVTPKTISSESLSASKSDLVYLHKLEGRGKRKTVKNPCAMAETDPYEKYAYTANMNNSVHCNNNKKRNSKIFNFIRPRDDDKRNSFIKSVEFSPEEFFESYARFPDKSLKASNCNDVEHKIRNADKTNGNHTQHSSMSMQHEMDQGQEAPCDRAKVYVYRGQSGTTSSCDSESETELRPKLDLSHLYCAAELASRNSKESSGTLSAASADEDEGRFSKDVTGHRPSDKNSWNTWCDLSSEDSSFNKCKNQWSNHIEGFVI
ncbi:uncharacterized protein LOC106170010 isoform X3 [Lingula anatina]|uniref:Uncharacterized protein LOC106170010 isoform X3 n=1 Tax=Lingula anatina TaxID=7574 RepID=A0A1S3J414_LINAN|nr:uncharacterized protein LOC106170010 isoform X3 [Lingula anatina]|eukprot:XP_013405167.1 uncharacterized protein LOC106170010 isoform X3 [Lingula anatina]